MRILRVRVAYIPSVGQRMTIASFDVFYLVLTLI